jgi:hypothetical protein
VVAVCGLGSITAAHGQVTLTEVTRYNLFNTRNPEETTGGANPLYTGNNTAAVGWNGSRLFVAGINNVSPSDITGIIEILNTATTGIVASTAVQYGDRFGAQAGTVESGRGYSGLTLSGNRLFAAWDNDTGNDGAGQFAGYDISTAANSTLWTTNNRGSAGVAIDPGYVVSGSSLGGGGVGWATFGGTNPPGSAERRAVTDPQTGAFIYGFAASGTVPAGFDWRPVGSAGVGRDISFDPDTGNLYGRSNNLVTAAVRTGTNSASPVTFIGGTASGGNASGQNIAFMSNTVAGDLLAFNNRQSGGTTQTFKQAVRLMSTSGSVQSVNWNFLGGAAYGDQVVQGPIYDFAFDPVSQTLAVVGAQGTLGLSIFRFGTPAPSTRLEWAASGTTQGGDGTWSTSGTTWSGAYGPEVWNPAAQAVFTGTAFPTSAVTVAAGGGKRGPRHVVRHEWLHDRWRRDHPHGHDRVHEQPLRRAWRERDGQYRDLVHRRPHEVGGRHTRHRRHDHGRQPVDQQRHAGRGPDRRDPVVAGYLDPGQWHARRHAAGGRLCRAGRPLARWCGPGERLGDDVRWGHAVSRLELGFYEAWS